MKTLTVQTDLRAGMVNPASQFCEQQGGKSLIVSDSSGNQYGLCQLADNKTQEEWAYFNLCAPQGA